MPFFLSPFSFFFLSRLTGVNDTYHLQKAADALPPDGEDKDGRDQEIRRPQLVGSYLSSTGASCGAPLGAEGEGGVYEKSFMGSRGKEKKRQERQDRVDKSWERGLFCDKASV